MFKKFRYIAFGAVFVKCQMSSGTTSVKKVRSDSSGLYVKGYIGDFYLEPDGSLAGSAACYGGDPVSWSFCIGSPNRSRMQCHQFKNLNKV